MWVVNLLQCYNFVTNLINRKETQTSYKNSSSYSVSVELQTFYKKIDIAWAANKYTQSVITLQP